MYRKETWRMNGQSRDVSGVFTEVVLVALRAQKFHKQQALSRGVHARMYVISIVRVYVPHTGSIGISLRQKRPLC